MDLLETVLTLLHITLCNGIFVEPLQVMCTDPCGTEQRCRMPCFFGVFFHHVLFAL